MVNQILYYIGVTALVAGGVIIAISVFVSIGASVRNSRAERAEHNTTDASEANDPVAETSEVNSALVHDVDIKEVDNNE